MSHTTNYVAPVSAAEALAISARDSLTSSYKQSETLSENDELSYPWESASSEELVSNNTMATITSLQAPFSSNHETDNTMEIITSLQAPLSSIHETDNTMKIITSLDAPLSPAWPSTLSSEDFSPPSPKPKRTFPPKPIPYPWSLARPEERKITKENDHFPFLKLPTELRHMIYTLHLSKGGDFDAIPIFYHRRPVIGVNLLATCKQIYVEAVQHVYLGRNWNIGQQWIHPMWPSPAFTLFDDGFYYRAMNDRALARIEHLRITIPVPSRNPLVHCKPMHMHQLKKMKGLRTLNITFALCGCSSLAPISSSLLGGSVISQVLTVADDDSVEISGTLMPKGCRKELETNVKWQHAHESALMASRCILFAPKMSQEQL